MKRRSFLTTSLAAVGSVAVAAAAPADEAKPKATELYELRVWSLGAAKHPVLDGYLSKAFLPALKRYGIGPAGVFVEKLDKEKQVRVYVLIVHPSAEGVATLPAR